jgi:hypothetical protein
MTTLSCSVIWIEVVDFSMNGKYLAEMERYQESYAEQHKSLGSWGDAPVHSIAATMMLRKDEFHFFNDIGYR